MIAIEALDLKKITVDENSPWIVFIHGLFDSIDGFDKVVNYIRDNSCYNILLLSLPAHGNDRNSNHITFYDSVLKLADIVNIHCSECHIVGFSMGGRFATLMASFLNIKIKSLILIDISLTPPKNAFIALKERLSNINQNIFSEHDKEILIKNNGFLSELSFIKINESSWVWNLNIKIILSWLKEIKNEDFCSYWDSLKIPKLVLYSTKSGYLSSWDIQFFERGGQVIALNGGHALHKVYPLEVGNIILEFIKNKR